MLFVFFLVKIAELIPFLPDDDEIDNIPVEKTEEGTALVEEFLLEWARRKDAAADLSENDGGGAKRRKLHPQTELTELVQEYRGRMEANPWVSKVLQTF